MTPTVNIPLLGVYVSGNTSHTPDGRRDMALSELQAAEREGWQLAKGLQGKRQQRVKEALAKVRRWQAHLLDEIDRREKAEEVLLDTFILLGDTTEGIKALDMLTFLPSRRR
jgi:hypothetical protein